MGLFSFRRKKDVIDLGEIYKKRKEKAEQISSESKDSSQNNAGGFAFFDTQKTPEKEETIDLSDTGHEKKRKLAKRLMEMTSRLEDLSNQIYHLQQRIEVLERKLNVNKY
jgi:hypothetical protein